MKSTQILRKRPGALLTKLVTQLVEVRFVTCSGRVNGLTSKGAVDPAQKIEGSRKGSQSDFSCAIGVLRHVLMRLWKVQGTQRRMIAVARTQVKGKT